MYLYEPDKHLPAVATLLNAKALADRLTPLIGDCELKIQNIRYKPGTSCLVSYELMKGGSAHFIHAKSFRADDWTVRRKKMANAMIADDDLSFAVFQFPYDTKIKSIELLTAEPARLLSRILFDELAGSSFLSSTVLAYKPNRRFVTRIDLEDREPFVLKFHDKSTFKSALNFSSALKNRSIGCLPERIGRSASHHALAYRWMSGEKLVIEKLDPQNLSVTMEMIFRWLDELHQPMNTRKIPLRVRPPSIGISEMANYLTRICQPLSQLAGEVSGLLLDSQSDEFAPCLIHGDFYDQQILQSESKIKVCDFDECCVGDSTADLANFVAHLIYRQVVQNASVNVEQVIADCHQQFNKNRSARDIPRFDWNTAACLFRLSAHPFRSGCDDWQAKTQVLLDHIQNMAVAVRSQATTTTAVTGQIDCSNAVMDDATFEFMFPALDHSIANKTIKKKLSRFSERTGEFSIRNIKAIRHKAGRRCLVEYQLATDQGFRAILGKASARRLNKNAFRNQKDLFRHHGFDYSSSDGISVPRPIGKCKPWQMWFQEKVDATPASQFMRDEQLSQISERIAFAISKLHNSNFKPNRKFSVDDELEILESRLSKMKAHLPECSFEIQTILDDCFLIGRSADDCLEVPIHRDFYQDQILVSNDRTYLVDLDLISLGNSAIDIGNFCAHLVEDGIRNHNDPCRWEREEQQFVDTYTRLNPGCSRPAIVAMKAISFARHISISWSILARRLHTKRIIDVAGRLLNNCKANLNNEILKSKVEIGAEP